MKELYVVRHAKSSWDDPELNDHDRPLNKRGEKDAPRMAKRLKEREAVADFMISSTATRALETCRVIAKGLEYPGRKIFLQPTLYHASPDTVLQVVHSIPDHYRHVFLFGHNPGLTSFCNQLLNAEILNIPTCGIVQASIEVQEWKLVSWGMGKLVWFDYPKSKSD